MAQITQAQAEKVLELVKARFSAWIDNDEYGPKLVKGWTGYDTAADYAILWEEGAYEWTLGLNDVTEEEYGMAAELAAEFGIEYTSKVRTQVTVPGTYLEPITSWALGIYPA
jgi:hypothetical protein